MSESKRRTIANNVDLQLVSVDNVRRKRKTRASLGSALPSLGATAPRKNVPGGAAPAPGRKAVYWRA